jgi:hypothetical protein
MEILLAYNGLNGINYGYYSYILYIYIYGYYSINDIMAIIVTKPGNTLNIFHGDRWRYLMAQWDNYGDNNGKSFA